MSDFICEHDRNRESCEDCAYQRAKDAGLPLGGPPPAQTRAQASDDTPPTAAGKSNAGRAKPKTAG